jgi:hypothetical protein
LIYTRHTVLASLLAIVATPVTASGQAAGWRWSAACPTPRGMALTVRLDTTLLYQSSFPICRLRDETSSLSRQITFIFKPARDIIWKGYRSDTGERTRAARPMEVRLWQAGADTIGPLLGVAITSGDTIYVNSIHIAWADSAATTELAEGLTVTTYPIKPRGSR